MRGDGTGRFLFPLRSTEERSDGRGRSSPEKPVVRKLGKGERKIEKSKTNSRRCFFQAMLREEMAQAGPCSFYGVSEEW